MADTPYSAVLETRCLVGGAWEGEGTTPVTDPACGDTLAHVPDLGAAGAQRAVDAAAAALGPWGAETVKTRARILRAWYDLVLENREALAALLTAEQGKPLAEALGEIDYAASYIEYYAEEAKRILGEVIPAAAGNARAMVLRQPIGVVAVITPWNFPAAMITRKVAPALACGCAVVLKPAPETPLTALALARLADRAGVPAGVLNVITGDAPAIGDVFLSHEDVRLVGFTGSTAVGKHLMRGAADGMKRVALELGGNAPFIVFDDADLDAAVAGVIASKFRNMGQTCVCANRIYVQSGVHDAFVERLAAAVKSLKVGDGREPGVQQGPLINMAAVEKVEAHVADALEKGGTLVTGGKRHALGQTFFEPTVVTGMRADMLAACSETFGPIAPVFAFESEAEVLAAANDSDAGLAAYFFTRDLSRTYRMLERLQFGMVGCNTGVLSSELAPFGGVKQSGNAREGSHHGIAEFTELKYGVIGGLEL
ncbi:NAD-dependent succinate-semialdehyde dehydrogenase [Stappia sp. ES.058]|uniref:NAD-dependent succinate-semialdehyde dehydrogenase n=1 Tax=Stappia sp. ES.058 TaxID=1881061 RepID=UPI00087A570C|nr:NAD-dependent succinate-semialdehyde dehydrogenase [Stappia sp. ES.058]SDT90748.1 succinate semialdehyde dehydrogenase [Stappia sp. ES.058]